MNPLGHLSPRWLFAIPLAALLIAAACGASSDSVASASVAAEASTTVVSQSTDSTLAGIEAAQWGDNVTISVGEDTFRFESDGLPNHEVPDQYLVPAAGNQPPFSSDDSKSFEIVNSDEWLVASPLDVEITLNPVYSEEVTNTNLGQIGVAISGAQLFNDYEDMQLSIVAIDDSVEIDGAYFLDPCSGHGLASGMDYHYHGVPYCITDVVDVAGQHSTILGVLLDGFPFYGPNDVDGESIDSAELDECSGHEGATPEFPDGIYHYHLTEDMAPYSIDCYHGVIDASATMGAGAPPGAGGGPGAGAPPGAGGGLDLAAAAVALGVTEAELQAALGGPPPDFEAAAAILGVSVEELQALLPAPGGAGPAGPATTPPGAIPIDPPQDVADPAPAIPVPRQSPTATPTMPT